MLADRWQSVDGHKLVQRVVTRLIKGESLDGLGLSWHEGRVDLRGFRVPEPELGGEDSVGGWVVERVEGNLQLEDVHLQDLDFRGAHLRGLRVFRGRLTNCRFDGADCRDWRLWATDVEGTTFIAADLRAGALGGWLSGRGNRFRNVDFSRADLRNTESSTASYEDCRFADTRLDKMDFQSSTFVRCQFSGDLREVIFWNRGFQDPRAESNTMEGVDFSGARFRDVEFRGLSLESVRLPEDPDHFKSHHYTCVLQRGLDRLSHDSSPKMRAIRALFEHTLKWAAPNQCRGVFAVHDFVGDSEDAKRFMTSFLEKLESECKRWSNQ